MRYTRILLLPAVIFAVLTTPDFTRAQGSGYAVTERGADYQVWQTTTVENGVNRVHGYMELATGLNYTNTSGQWVPSREQITVLAQGGAVAVQGQHQVYFPADIYNGVIDVITPDGRELRSRPLGVSYDDGTNTVFIGTLTNSIGWLVSSNQVVYTNAFSGLKADLVCTYRRSGFECDLVFRQQPPKPVRYGLSNARSTLQLVTEFFNTADPQTLPGQTNAEFGLQDSTLQFGRMTMTQGKAFAVGGGGGQTNLLSRLKTGMTSVYKRWVHAGGRTFLIEEVPLVRLTNDLAALPLTASAAVPGGQRLMASGHREFPAAHGLLADTNQILLAAAESSRQPGVVLDYVTVNSGGDYTFQGNTTYYVSGPCYFGNVTFNGGAVMKYPNYYSTTAFISVSGALTCNTSSGSPAIFTAYDDNTVGESLTSYGYPSGNYYANPAIYAPGPGANISLSNVRISYAEEAVGVGDDSSITLSDAQVNDCQIMARLGLGDGSGNPLTLTCNNCLYNAPYYGILVYDGGNGGDRYNLTNCTLNNVYYMVIAPSYYYPDQINAVNCIFASSSLTVEGYCTWSGGYNGFYYAGTTFGSPATTTTSNPFQTSGSDGFYLASGSTFRNAGTTGISSTLLADLQTLTTSAPSAGGWPDNDGMPDLGYHYPLQDSDGDGLPDWWEMYWFGTLVETGSSLDANGNTLATDYQNYLNGTPTDPDIIAFTIATTNNYVNHTNASVQLNITGGFPAKYAVSVDDTNYAADASWHTYMGTNLTVNLGTTQGWHNIWIALKGPATNATVTWAWTRLKLDLTPPQLTITSPTNSTVTVPLIQLAGFCPEPLDSISYDLTNALGLVTNQDAGITSQHYDTNTWDFTTNYFEALDIPLTNGVNTIILHATDLAGNMTTLTTNFTLDYTTATNPVVNLYWPQNGTLVCNGNYTWRGWVDDPTATVTASITDTNGNTNIFYGLVERNGDFWVENLPMTGTSYLTLTVTNAAGHVSATNITVFPGAVGMTITMPSADQLWNQGLTVNGTITDSSDYTVWVNGEKASYTDGTDWTATNVYLLTGGTALIQARAIPNTSNGGNGTGGSGGGPVTYDNLGNPDPLQDNDAESQVDKQPRLYMESYAESDGSTAAGTFPAAPPHPDTCFWSFNFTGVNSFSWTDNVGGAGSSADHYDYTNIDCSGGYNYYSVAASNSSPASPWESIAAGIADITSEDNYSYSGYSGDPIDHYTGDWMPPVLWEDCHVQMPVGADSGGWPYQWEEGIYNDSGEYHRTADAVLKLKTGGKGLSRRQNLFQLTCSATEILDQRAYAESYQSLFPDPVAAESIESQDIEVDSRPVGSDGNQWRAYADNDTRDVTPRVKNVNFYTFWLTQQKYEPYITANDIPLDPDSIQVTNCVGQKIIFKLRFDPDLPSGILVTNQNNWWLPPDYKNAYVWFQPDDPDLNPDNGTYYLTTCDPGSTNYYAMGYGVELPACTTYSQSSWPLTQPETGAWWISSGLKAVTCFPTLTLTNGQNISLGSVQGNFYMYRPNLINFTNNNPQFQNTVRSFLWDGTTLSYGNIGNNEHGLYWSVDVNSTMFDGQIAVVQLANLYYMQNYPTGPTGFSLPDTGGDFWLDGNTVDYSEQNYFVAYPQTHTILLYDDPNAALNTLFPYNIYMTGQFKDYVQFQPSGSGSIPVTLGANSWSMTGEATLTSGIITNSTPAPTAPKDSDEFPVWTQVQHE